MILSCIRVSEITFIMYTHKQNIEKPNISHIYNCVLFNGKHAYFYCDRR